MEKPVVLITGGLTGIGRTTAVAFAAEGAGFVVSGRRDAAGKALETELRAAVPKRLSSRPMSAMKRKSAASSI